MEELSKLKGDIDRLMAVNKVVLALVMEISELETTTGSLFGSLYEIKATSAETERHLKKAQKICLVGIS